MRKLILPGLLVLVLAIVASGLQEKPPVPPKQDDDIDREWQDPVDNMSGAGPELGKILYTKYCLQCHGEKGDGKGPLAEFLDPHPRDFTSGMFKCRSTPTNTLPAKMDLMRAIVHGIPLSAMLSYSFLQTDDQVTLMEYVKSLCRKPYLVDGKEAQLNPFEREGHGKPLKSGNIPQKTLPVAKGDDLSIGKAAFKKLGCWECHGETGDGKGPKAAGLKYDDGNPISVRDLTQGIYSGGPDVRHLYLRLSLGIPGTPMPSFALTSSIEERWKVALYVYSLGEERRKKNNAPLPHSETLKAVKVKALPADVYSKEWDDLAAKAPEKPPAGDYTAKTKFFSLPLFFQQLKHKAGRPYYTAANARAIHDGKSIAILLEWDDAKSEAGDMVEIQLSPSRQFQFAVHGTKVVREKDWSDDDFKQQQLQNQVNLWRWSAKEPEKGVEVDAFGPFDEAVQKDQGVKAVGKWKDGKWRVMFTRLITSPSMSDAPFDIGQGVPILFQMWDAAWEDAAFQRLFTTWHTINLAGE